jgi:hypothetical protein
MDNDSETDAQEQHAPPTAPVGSSACPPNQPTLSDGKENHAKKQPRDYSNLRPFGFPLLEFSQFIFNLCLVIAGVIGTVVIVRQLNLMEEQLADSRAGAQDARRAIAVTEKTLQTTQTAMRLDQRAWVFVVNAETTPNGVRLAARNIGKTPAVNVTMLGSIDSKYPPLLDPFVGAIPPGELQRFDVPLFAQWTDRTDVTGQITYKDVFGEQHFTRFCFGVSVVKERPILTRCSAHNTIDYDGKEDPPQTIIEVDPQ